MNKNNRGIIFYLLISFVLSWAIWGIPLLTGTPAASSAFQSIQITGALAPALAAAIVRQFITHEGFGDSGFGLRLREKWPYLVVAALLPIAVTAIILTLAVIFRLGEPDFSLSLLLQQLVPPGQPVPAPGAIWIQVIFQLLINSGILTLFLFGEEFGWRGYLQKRLFIGRPVKAAVATGVIWGLWNLPLNITGYYYNGHSILGPFVFIVTAVLLSVIFGWLFQKSESVWIPSLAHASASTLGLSLTQLLFAGSSDYLFTSYFGILGWIPLGALCAWIILTHRLKPPVDTSNPAETISEAKK